MAGCGCGCGQQESNNYNGGQNGGFSFNKAGPGGMDLYKAIQLLAGLAAIVGVVQYLSKN